MPRRPKKYHFIYQTTCLITGKFYIGMHSTNELDDGYMGSGKRLWYSFKKYGKDKHETKILEYLPDRKSLSKREREIVNENLINAKMCMNIAIGGEGGAGAKLGGQAFKQKLETDKDFADVFKATKSLLMKRTHAEGKFRHDTMTGKHHSVETKQKIGKATSKIQSGKNNSQYGTCWIYNEILKECKKISKDDINMWLYGDWKKGRKMKF